MELSVINREKNIKILLVTHKPCDIPKHEYIIPIHAGRDVAMENSKDGKITNKDLNWLLKNTIGDNTGDNISNLNRYFNEMSAVYWCWKNYDKIGNPDYIGLMHYRRHFIFSEKNYSKSTLLDKSYIYSYNFIDEKYMKLLDERYVGSLIDKYDIICPHKYNANNLNDGHYYRNCKERFVELSKTSTKWYEKMDNIVRTSYPEFSDELDYLDKKPNHYLFNMFVMKKELFNKYCSFVFDVLFKLYDEFKNTNTDVWQYRAIAFLSEFLTSIYISYYRTRNSNMVKELDVTYIENINKKNKLNILKNNLYRRINKIKDKIRNNNVNNYIKQQNEYIIKQIEDLDKKIEELSRKIK